MEKQYGKKYYECVDFLFLETTTAGLFQIAGDSPIGLMLDSDGVPLLPGTSIAGAVQDYLKEKKNTNYPSFWGDSISRYDNKVYFYDSPLRNDLSSGLENVIDIRKCHAHDKELGGAADKKMFERTFLKQGCRFHVIVKVFSLKTEKKQVEAFFQDMAKGIQKGWILFGGNKNAGAGQLRIERVKHAHFDMFDLSSLKSYYLFQPLEINDPSYVEYGFSQEGTNNQVISISLDGQIRDAILLKGEDKETDEEGHQIATSIKSNGQYIIPGTTWKGVLRSYCEKICKTLEMGEEKRTDLLEVMFGTNNDGTKNGEKQQCGKVRVHDTVIEEPATKCYTRIKIDRFTGGTISGAKLTSNAITKGKVKIALDFLPIMEEVQRKQAIALLFLTVRDLGLSKIPLGSMASVGFGRIRGTQISISIPEKYRIDSDIKEQENIDLEVEDRKASLICSDKVRTYLEECIGLLAREDV